MSLDEAAEWMKRRRAGSERTGPGVSVRSDRGARTIIVEAPGRLPAVIYPGRVTFEGQGAYDVSVTLAVDGERLDVAEVAFRPRPGGAPITRRGIQGVNVGALMVEAVGHLSEGVDQSGNWQRVEVAAPLRRALLPRPASEKKRGNRAYSDDELRFFVAAYKAAPARGKYEHIRRAYDRDPRWRNEAGSLSPEALRWRRMVAKARVDPATGEKFLLPAS